MLGSTKYRTRNSQGVLPDSAPNHCSTKCRVCTVHKWHCKLVHKHTCSELSRELWWTVKGVGRRYCTVQDQRLEVWGVEIKEKGGWEGTWTGRSEGREGGSQR